MKNEILIVGLLSYEDPKYWDFCNKCIEKTISSSGIVRYLIGLDRVSKSNRKKLESYLPRLSLYDISITPKKKKETTHDKRIRIGSLYNKIFSHIPNDEKYVFSLDGDIALLCHDWDTLLINELKNDCVVIGHEYGPRWPKKYQDFPCLQCSFFDGSKVNKLNVDFRGDGKPFKIKTEKHSRIFGLPIGTNLNRDIGWKWPLRIQEAGYSAKIMQFVPGNDKRSKILQPKTKHDKKVYSINQKENIKSLFEIHWKKKVIATHLTKSTCLEFNKHPVCKYWLRRVEGYLEK